MRSLFLAASVSVFAALAACAPAAAPVRAERAAQSTEAVAAFLEAFVAMDAPRFDALFAEDVTMFFPAGPFPTERVVGKAAVTSAFHNFFAMARARGIARLPIQPLDLEIQDYGEFSVATFHLRGNGNIGRRSLLLRREPGGWRIVHFHASSLEALSSEE